MKRIVAINSVPYGSTGKIMLGIASVADSKGFESIVCSGFSFHPLQEYFQLGRGKYIKIGNIVTKAFHMVMSKVTGLEGFFSFFSTLLFLRKIKKMRPDALHFHNLHSWYINLPLLFRFVKKNNIPVI